MNISEAVQEIIDGEEIDRSTPGEVMTELDMMVQRLEFKTAHIAELERRIDDIITIANQIEADSNGRAWEIVERVSDVGTHAERSQSILVGMTLIRKLVGQIQWDVNRVKQAAAGRKPHEARDMDDIPW